MYAHFALRAVVNFKYWTSPITFVEIKFHIEPYIGHQFYWTEITYLDFFISHVAMVMKLQLQKTKEGLTCVLGNHTHILILA